MALGHFAMAIEKEHVFYFALALLIIGNGFFKPNISTIVGKLYPPGDPRRDSGFTIFYMGINLGAGAAPARLRLARADLQLELGFGAAGVGMLLGLVVFLWGQKLLAGAADPPDEEELKKRVVPGLSKEHSVYVGAAMAVLLAWQLVQHGQLVGRLLGGVGVLVLGALVFYMVRKCDKTERDQLTVALVLTMFSMVFWAFFEQAGSSISLFTDRNVDRHFLGSVLPASIFQSVNPAFILILAPMFSWLWLKLARVEHEPRTPTKFGIGIILLGSGFGALYMGAATASKEGMVWLGWLILGYFLHTTGELCLSPIGLSMITKLSPARIAGLMMGTWFFSTAFAQYIAGLVATLTGVHGEGSATKSLPAPTETVMVYGSVFLKIGIVAACVGVFVLLLSPYLSKKMHGVH